MDISWLVGGPQGSGVESAASIFSRLYAKVGFNIFGKREFYSNIKGMHSYFTIRISDDTIRSNTNDIDIMVAFDAETIFRHAHEIAKNGILIYNADVADTKISDTNMNDEYSDRLQKHLASENLTPDISGIMNLAKQNGVLIHSVSFKELLSDLSTKLNNPRLSGMVRMYNVIAVSLSYGLLKGNLDLLVESIEQIFSSKPKVAQLNIDVAKHTFEKIQQQQIPFNIAIPKVDPPIHTMLLQGHYGTSIGKIISGCRFQSYYPITPASDESSFLESHNQFDVVDSRPGCTVVVQTEDEISALGMAIGSALTGTRSSTCTSGPGFSLMAEMLGWAGINEVPIVVTLYQRSGPSTGLPTRHGQDDLLFAIYAGHGEFLRIVYASGDIEESFYDTCKCFNMSDIYQVPVIHMMDKFLASTVATCPRFDTDSVQIDRGKLLERGVENYKRFALTPDGISPRSKLGLEDGIFWNTGDESDQTGHVTEDPVLRDTMMDKRLFKSKYILDTLTDDDKAISFGVSQYTIISWGSCKGPILDAIQMLKRDGINVGFVQVKLLQPFPADLIRRLLDLAEIVIDVEANHTAQLGQLLQTHTGRNPDNYILKYSGRVMTCTELYHTVKKITQGLAKKREVLTYGV